MKLTEIVVCTMIFLISATAFMGAFVNVQKSSKRTALVSASVSTAAKTDFLIRKEIQDVKIPYWKNVHKGAESVMEKIRRFGAEAGIEITDIYPVYEKTYDMEGFQVEWNSNGKKYVTREYLRQRIADEKE